MQSTATASAESTETAPQNSAPAESTESKTAPQNNDTPAGTH